MAERRTVLPKASVDTLSIGISTSTNCDPPSDAEAKRTIFIRVLRIARNGRAFTYQVEVLRLASRFDHRRRCVFPPVRAPGPSRRPIRREARAPCGRQVASVLRKNLAGEDGDPLAMACGPIFGIGIDNFATGEHTGQKRLPSRCPFRHPAVRRPYGLFQIVGAPRRPIAGPEPKRDLRPFFPPPAPRGGGGRPDLMAHAPLPSGESCCRTTGTGVHCDYPSRNSSHASTRPGRLNLRR